MSMEMSKTLELGKCIEYYENVITYSRFLMDPCTQVIVESTIGHLKELMGIHERQSAKEHVDESIIENPEKSLP